MSKDETTAFFTKNLCGETIEVVPRKVYDSVVGKLQAALQSYRDHEEPKS